MRIVLLAALSLIPACKRDEPPARTPVADARVAAPADAAPRADAAPAPAPVDAAGASDAQPADAGAAPRDTGARKPPRPSPDAGPPAAPDAGAEPAAGACRRTEFETKLVGDACAEGGQAAAKAAMKKWVRTAKKQEPKLECKSCHDKLAPQYSLKDDGLEHFRRLGGT